MESHPNRHRRTQLRHRQLPNGIDLYVDDKGAINGSPFNLPLTIIAHTLGHPAALFVNALALTTDHTGNTHSLTDQRIKDRTDAIVPMPFPEVLHAVIKTRSTPRIRTDQRHAQSHVNRAGCGRRHQGDTRTLNPTQRPMTKRDCHFSTDLPDQSRRRHRPYLRRMPREHWLDLEDVPDRDSAYRYITDSCYLPDPDNELGKPGAGTFEDAGDESSHAWHIFLAWELFQTDSLHRSSPDLAGVDMATQLACYAARAEPNFSSSEDSAHLSGGTDSAQSA